MTFIPVLSHKCQAWNGSTASDFPSEVHATEEICKDVNYIVDVVMLGAFISVN